MAKTINSGNKKPAKVSLTKYELPISGLRWTCPPSTFKFKSTESLKPLDKIVGQERAIKAIKLGSELFSKGYNIFVSGLSGTGRMTTVKKLLMEVTEHCPQTYDYCYVNNFNNADHPRLIRLNSGEGRKFAAAMEEKITFLRSRLPKLFEEESFQKTRRKIVEDYQQKERNILAKFDEKIEPFGFIRGQIENEQGLNTPEVFPVIDEKPFQIEDIEQYVDSGKITRKDAEKTKELYHKFHNEIYNLARQNMKLMQEFRKALSENDKAGATLEVSTVFDDIKDTFKDEKVNIYIEEVKEYILDNLNMFIPSENQVLQNGLLGVPQKTGDFSLFTINVILDNSETNCAPVVIETTPSYPNLFGAIERVYDSRGFWRTDFTNIKAGSLLKADQGYIIVSAMDMFSEPGVWTALKRVLLYDKLEIQNYETYFNFAQSHLKPEPINVNIKVVIIGGQTLYRALYLYEKGFKKIFKINAQFDYETKKSKKMMNYYARFISKICNDEGFPHCSQDGVAAIIEWAVEKAGSKDRITLKFSDVADILREAAFHDKHSNRKLINREDVEKAINERRYRNNLMDDKIQHYIISGSTMIDTDGSRVGQINGLTVYDTGILSFGKPARITASVSAGNSGIINIERESEMSGSIHNKGVLILTGFIREKFAQDQPLSLTASIAFEQSYGGIDGDSATAAEIYVILSALSGVPIRQDIAITGSVNQKGDIQPIGGVNDKIRGFFEICDIRGLTGNQGVIIPQQNVNDLMLCREVVEAVKSKNFHIYSIRNIDEGASLLMGLNTGRLNKYGKYTAGSLYAKVVDRLSRLHEASNGSDKKKKKKS